LVLTFKTNRSYNHLLLLVYGLIIFWPIYFKVTHCYIQPNSPVLYKWLIGSLNITQSTSSVFFGISSIVLLFIQAILINNIVNRNKLFAKEHYLTGMCYLLFISFYITKLELSPVLLSSTSILWILYKLCSLQTMQNPKTVIFNISIVLGLTTMIYTPTLLFILVLFFALIITRPFKFPEWVMVFVGISVPYYFIWSFLFINGIKNINPLPLIDLAIPVIQFTKWEVLINILIGLLLLIGFVYIQQNSRKLLFQSRNNWTIIYFYLFIAILCPFLNNNSSIGDFIFILSPICTIGAAFFFYPKKNLIPSVVHLLLLAFSIYLSYVNVFN